MTQQRLKTQVLVIGAGISGSTSALTLADAGYEVTLIVPGKELDGGNSALAQGGIVYRSDPNDAKDLEKDILIAGHHHNYVKAVRHLCQHGPEAVERILMERAPIPFDRLDGKLDFTREGGTASTASCTAPTTPGKLSWKAYCRPCACLRTSAS